MSFPTNEAEGHAYFTGPPPADPYSQNPQPLQRFSTSPACLADVGAQFYSPSASRKGSYDTNLSGDEAFTTQSDTEATTPRADHNLWLPYSPNRGRPENFPPTPRLTPVQESPYLTPSEYAEFERRRAVRNRRNTVFDPYRSPLEDTPRGSPTGTAYTSVQLDSDREDGFAPHDHVQDDFSAPHTPSQRSYGTDENTENDNQDGVFIPYPYSEGHYYLPENAHNGTVELGEMASSVAGPRYADSLASQSHGL